MNKLNLKGILQEYPNLYTKEISPPYSLGKNPKLVNKSIPAPGKHLHPICFTTCRRSETCYWSHLEQHPNGPLASS